MALSKNNSFLSLKVSRLWLTLGAVLVVLVIGGMAWHMHNKTKKTVTTIPSTSPSPSPAKSPSGNNSSSNGTSSSSDSGTPPNDKQNPVATDSGLIKPYGQFVSSHHLTGSPDETEESACTTTPGATCYIKFTKGNETHQLEAKKVDGSGTAYWRWSATTANLSQGSWTITAVTTLNGETLSTQDAQNLEVQP